MDTPRPNLRRIELRAGQSQALCLPQGTQIRVLRGSVLLAEPPQWLGETMHLLTRRVHRGEGHVLTQRGWLQVLAGAHPTVLELSGHLPAGTAAGRARADVKVATGAARI